VKPFHDPENCPRHALPAAGKVLKPHRHRKAALFQDSRQDTSADKVDKKQVLPPKQEMAG